jgi:HEAT repeat protein
MFPSLSRPAVGLALLVLLLPGAAGSQEFIVPYLKTPETPREFWAAVKYELDLGNHRRAGEMLQGFWDRLAKLDEAERAKTLLQFYDEDGMSAFLRLSNVEALRKVMAKDPATGQERPVPDLLIAEVSRAVNARLGDPKRITFYIGNLRSPTPEVRAYALMQLRQSGAYAVPHLVAVLRDESRKDDHAAVVDALVRLGGDAVPPLLAALDLNEPYVRSLLIEVFVRRGDERVVPVLWYLHGLRNQPEKVRQQATEALVRFLRVPADRLDEPRAVLTREAERYYGHEARLPPGERLVLWRWDEKTGLVSQTVSRGEYETYQGVSFARKALDLDPAYRPAQVILLSLLLQQAYERGGVAKPLQETAPELHNLLAATDSALLEAVLARALADGRTAVALGAARALGENSDWRLVRGSDRGPPPLVRALSYPDPRVQFAAAEAILRIPTTEPFPGNSRVVEVLARAVAPEPSPKALVALGDVGEGQKLAALLRSWGYDVVLATSGRGALRLAADTPGLAVIYLDARLPDPGLAHLLAQLRASPDTAGTPVVLFAPREQERAMQALGERYTRVLVLAPQPASPDVLKAHVEELLNDPASPPLSAEERSAQAKAALHWLQVIARGERPGYDLRPADAALYRALASDELAIRAVEVLAYLRGRRPQEALAGLALNETRPAPLRAEAARQLRLSVQRHGILLEPKQLAGLLTLATAADNPLLREEASRLAVTLKPDATDSGNRLRDFPPPLPMPEKREK